MTYLAASKNAANKYYIDGNGWNHITMVVTADTTESGEHTINLYLYINGEYAGLAATNTNSLATASITEFRLGCTNTTDSIADVIGEEVDTGVAELCYDNVYARAFKTGYDRSSLDSIITSKSDITAWGDNAYYADNAPKNSEVVAKLGNETYDGVQNALRAAEPGDVITLMADVDAIYFDRTGVAIDTNGYTVGKISSLSGTTVSQYGTIYKPFTTATLLDRKTMDFESVAAGTKYENGKTTLMQHAYNFIGQTGGQNSGTVVEENGNKYVDLVWGTPTSMVNPYIMANGPSTSPSTSSSHANYSLYTIELDVRFPTGKVVNSTKVGFEHRKLVGTSSSYEGCGDFYLKFFNDANGGVYLAYSQNAAQKFYIEPTSWNHITLAVTADTVGTVHTLTMHLFVNGEYMGSPYSLTIDNDAATFTYVRFSMQDSTSAATTQDCEVYLDNFTVRAYKATYDRTSFDNAAKVGGDLTDWADHIYFESQVPKGTDIAQLGDVKYDSVAKAIEAAKAGDVITLLGDIKSLYITKTGVAIDANGYNVEYVSAATGMTTVKLGEQYKALNSADVKLLGNLDFEGTLSHTEHTTVEAAAGHKIDTSLPYNYDYKGNAGGNSYIVTDDSGNKYFLFDYTVATKSAGSYIYGDYIWNASAADSHSAVDAYTVDVDVFAPAGRVANSTTILFAHRIYDGKNVDFGMNPSIAFYYDETLGLNYVISPGGSEKVYLAPDAWSHLSIVMTADTVVEGGVPTHTLKLYLYVNGESCGMLNSYTVSNETASITNVRFMFAYSSGAEEGKLALDNFNVRKFFKSYDRTNLDAVLASGADITEWYDSAYNPTLVPFGNAVAQNGETVYDNLQKAIDEAADGDTITILKNSAETVKVNKQLTFNYGQDPESGAYYTIAGIELAPGLIKNSYEGQDLIFSIAGKYFHYVKDGVDYYVATLDEAVANAPDGATITLVSDMTIEGETNANDNVHETLAPTVSSKTLTIDLAGKSITIKQNEQNPLFILSSGANITIRNGTIMAARTDNAGVFKDQTYPMFFVLSTATNVSLTLEDVDTYGTIFYNYKTKGDLTLTINGGEHYGTTPAQGAQLPALISIWGAIEVNVYDAFFFVDQSVSVISVMMKELTEAEIGDGAVIVFEGCTLIADPAETGGNNNLVANANKYTSITFNACDIFGAINPTVGANDYVDAEKTALHEPIGAGAIVLGDGTRYANGYTMLEGVVVADAGLEASNIRVSVDYTLNESADNFFTDGFAITTREINLVFNKIVSEEIDKYFEYIADGLVYYAEDIITAVNSADAGSVITLLKDYTLTSSKEGFATLGNNIIIDLGGFTFTLYQGSQACFYIGGNVTWRNGTFRAVRTNDVYSDGNTYEDKTFPALYAAGSNVTIRLENMTFYGGALICSAQANTRVEIEGGKYYTTQTVQGGWGGILDLRHASVVEANNAFFFADSDSWIVSDSAKSTNGSPSQSVYTFTGCQFISDPDDVGHIIKYANEYSKFYFYNCDIYGHINPTVHSGDVTYANGNYTQTKFNAIKAGGIVMGQGTRFDATKTLIGGGVIVAEGGYVFVTETSNGAYSITDVDDKPFTNGYNFTDRDISVTFTRQTATNGLAYYFAFTHKGTTVYTNDFFEAIKPDANTVVTLQKDFEIYSDVNGEFAKFSTAMTLDLGGHVFSVIQGHQAFIGIRANITIRNGELRVVCDDTLAGTSSYVDKSFPLFTMASGGKTLTITNVNTYAGSLVISRANNVTININGGQHHITHHSTSGYRGSWGGMFDVRAVTTVNISDAILFTDRSSWIVTSASSYADPNKTAAERLSVFTFTNTTIISDPTDAAPFDANDPTYGHIVKYANENTKLYFNNCNIVGSINPVAFSSDYKSGDGTNQQLGVWADIPAENIIFGEGTRIATSANGIVFTIKGYTCDGATLGLIDEQSKIGFVLKTCNDRPYSEGYKFATKTCFYTFDKVVADTVNITITFHNPDGTTFTETYRNGDVITALPEYATPEAVENGWVKITYAGGWSLTAYGEKIDSLTVTGRLHLWPAAVEAKAYLTAGMYNLSLYGNVGANILIPDIEYRPEGIILVGVYDMNGNEINLFASGLSAKGMTYSSYEAGRTGVISLDTPVKVQVKYTYYNVEFTQTITVTPLNYVKFALTSGATNPDAKTLLADMIVYADALNKYNKKDDNATIAAFAEVFTSTGKSLYDIANEFKSTLADPDEAFATEGAITDARNYIQSIAFNVGGADPSYVVTFRDGVRVVDVKFVMKNAYVNNVPGYDRGNVTYGTDTNKSSYVTGTNVLAMAHSEGISIYNLAEGNVEFILTVLDDNGGRHNVIVEGNYNLANYYNGIAEGGGFTAADIARAKDILIKLYTYGASSAAYRFGEENVGNDEELKSNIENVYYEDFGAKGDGVTDDFAAIQAAHAYANQKKDEGRDVTVYAIKPGGAIPAGSTFRMANTDTTSELYGTYAEIRTDVVWEGAKFIFDDSGLNNENYKVTNAAGKTAFGNPLFKVMPDVKDGNNPYYMEIKSYTENGGQLLKTQTHIETIKNLDVPFEWALVRVYNSQHAHYYRYGANASSTIQCEIILVNTRTGQIDPSTPLSHDFLSVYSLRLYDATCEPVTIKGGEITTLYNQVDSYDYSNRGVFVARSNTTLTGITNHYEYSDWNCSAVTHGSPIQFYNFEYVHGATIDNCIVEGPKVFYDQANSSGVGSIMRGSYTIRADHASSLTISNITQRNIYIEIDDATRGKTPDGMVDHQAVMGSNYCKNVLFENNIMSTFDSHSGIENLVVRGCTVERINVIGQGTIIVENTTIHAGITHAAIVLREDYNSNFRGDVYFKNVTLETYDEGYVGLFWMTYRNYNTGLYYAAGETFTVNKDTPNEETRNNTYYAQDTVKDGNDEHYYTAYLPENVYVEGLKVLAGGSITPDSDPNNILGGTYTPGTESTEVKLALYNGYKIAESESELTKMLHNWNCDVSTYGSYFWEGGFDLFGTHIGGTKYTVTNPIKPTERVYIDAETKAKYTLHEYVYSDKVYNNLAFLNNLQILEYVKE